MIFSTWNTSFPLCVRFNRSCRKIGEIAIMHHDSPARCRDLTGLLYFTLQTIQFALLLDNTPGSLYKTPLLYKTSAPQASTSYVVMFKYIVSNVAKMINTLLQWRYKSLPPIQSQWAISSVMSGVCCLVILRLHYVRFTVW